MNIEPPEKRQKCNDASSLDIIDLLSDVVRFRTEGPMIIKDVLSAETKEILALLSRLQVELNDSQLKSIIDIPAGQQHNMQSTLHQIEEKKKHITILTILHQKSKCPVARIIDEI